MTRHGTLGSPKSSLFQLGLFGHFYERRSSGVIRASFTAFQSPQRTSTSSPCKMACSMREKLSSSKRRAHSHTHGRIGAASSQICRHSYSTPTEGHRSARWYHLVSKRRPPHCDSLPARFYRMVMGKEWDGEGHSYSLATKRYRRLNPDDPYQQKERERQQGKKREYSKKKRPTDDNQRRQARRKAQREREKAAASMAV